MGAASSSPSENDVNSVSEDRIKNAKPLVVGAGEHTLEHDTIAYKKVACGYNRERCIATLLLPAGTTVIRPTMTNCDSSGECTSEVSDKMRVDKAIPVSVECKFNKSDK